LGAQYSPQVKRDCKNNLTMGDNYFMAGELTEGKIGAEAGDSML
jgi:hypothetical protein